VGLEVVQITMQLEDEFAIELGDDFWTARVWDDQSDRWDVQVRDIVAGLEQVIRERHGDVPQDIYPRLQKVLAYCLSLDEDKVVPEAWLVKDWNVG